MNGNEDLNCGMHEKYVNSAHGDDSEMNEFNADGEENVVAGKEEEVNDIALETCTFIEKKRDTHVFNDEKKWLCIVEKRLSTTVRKR